MPNNAALCYKILESEYDSRITGYIGIVKTTELFRRNFW